MQRRLKLTEGKSDKFWYIDVANSQVTVCYGRCGTAGTTKTKQYDSADKALAEAGKQVTAKIKRGYSDDPGAPTDSLAPATPTHPEGKPGPKTVAGDEEVVREAVICAAPLEVTDAAADDLGLRITPFEQAYDINADVKIEVDDSLFDPEAELERAKRIASVERISYSYYVNEHLRLSEPLFDKLPSPERIAWWVEYLEKLRDPKRRYTSWRGSDLDWPVWLRAVLRTNWRRPISKTASQLGELVEGALILRPILPTRSDAEIAAARASLPSPLPEPLSTRRYYGYEMTDTSVFTAAGLKALDPDLARELLAGLPKNILQDQDSRNWALVGLILPTAEERVAFARRTGARVVDWDGVVPWLVATGREGFALLLGWLDQQAREIALAMLRTAAEAGHGPGMTEFFVGALRTKAAEVASDWLRSHMSQALAASLTLTQAEALAPLIRELPIEQLRDIATQTRGNTRKVIDEILAEAATPELPAGTAWWAEALAATPLPPEQELPFHVDSLPAVMIDEYRLGTEQTQELLRALSAAERHPLVAAVHDHATRASRDGFAMVLFKLWMSAGAPSEQSWLMTGAGWLGDDEFVHTLTPLIREWPGISQHQRAVKGLTALRNVATDVALRQISGIASKVKFAALKKRAGEAMDEIAAQRGLTRDELEDRVLSDGGLDERGTRLFNYGPRQFLAYVTPEGKLAARLLDAGSRPKGKVLSTLPAPNKSDDAALAKASKAEYNSVKKAVTSLAKVQLERFERAMILDRRWSAEDHAQFIAPHPVLRRLLAGLVWAIHDGENLVSTTRVDEDGTLVDAQDEPVEAVGYTIGVAHRLDLSDEQQAEWAEALADYELTPPFKQLDRPIFQLPDDQGEDTRLHALPQGKLPATKFIGAFSKYGWERGAALDAGSYCLYGLPTPHAGITAVIQYAPGMWMGPLGEQEDQEFEAVYVLRGCHDPKDLGYGLGWDLKNKELLPWSRVPAKITSEVLATINQIAS